jgi:hypothetical protein
MNKDTVLKLCLSLLGVFLAIGPLLAALGTHNWDIMAAVMPSQEEMNQTQNALTGLFGGSLDNAVSVGTPELVGSTLRIPLTFNSPFNVPITITSLSSSITDGGTTIAQAQMAETQVNIETRGTGTITLAATYTGGIPSDPQLSGVNATFEIYGISVKLSMTTVWGGT